MNKITLVIEVDNLLYDTADTVRQILNRRLEKDYDLNEFYSDAFKGVLLNTYEEVVRKTIQETNQDRLSVFRIDKGVDKMIDIINRFIKEEPKDVAFVSYARAFDKEDTFYADVVGDLMAWSEKPVIYVGTDVKTCLQAPADLRVVVKVDGENRRNRTFGGEERLYIVNSLEEAAEVIEFYNQHPELVW